MFWNYPLNFPTLHQDEIHIWLACLTQPQQKIAEFWEILNEEERRKANRFIVNKRREHFIVARGILRKLLANYLNYPAHQINFSQGSHGKIEFNNSLITPIAANIIKFNLSHTDNYTLYAFAIDRELGIDIEHIRTNIEISKIAQRFFSPLETSALLSLPKEMQLQAFFNCWTRKEAFIKCIGKGLYYPLDKFDVDVKTNGETKIDLNIYDQSLQNKNWSLFSLDIIADYSTALAIEGSTEQKKLIKYKYNDYL